MRRYIDAVYTSNLSALIYTNVQNCSFTFFFQFYIRYALIFNAKMPFIFHLIYFPLISIARPVNLHFLLYRVVRCMFIIA